MYTFSLRYAGEMEITDPDESTNVISATTSDKGARKLVLMVLHRQLSLVSANLMRPRKCMFPEKTNHAADECNLENNLDFRSSLAP